MWHFMRSALALAPLALQAEGIRTASFDLESEFDSDDIEAWGNNGQLTDDVVQKLAAGEPMTEEDFTLVATSGGGGGDVVHSESCDDFLHDMIGLLEMLQVTFDTFSSLHNSSLGEESTVDMRTKIYQAVADEFRGDSLMVTAHSETANRKHCLDKVYRDPKVQKGIKSLLDKELNPLLEKCRSAEAPSLHCQEAYEKMVQWQHAVVKFADDHLFEELGTSDIKANCPKECSWCSRQHRSKYKKNEPFSFKCYLHKDNVVPTQVKIPSKQHTMINTNIKCKKPRRRTIKFWRKKAWCEVEDWKKAYIRQHKVAALFSCSTLLLAPSLQDVEESTLQSAHKVCMRVEQGIAVAKTDMELYRNTFKTSMKSTVSSWEESVRWATRTIMNLGMNAGMAELIHRSSHGSGHSPAPVPHHAGVKGGDGGHAPAPPGHNALDVFAREFPTTGGERYFNEALDDDDKYEVCHVPPRKMRGFFGVLSQFFRQALRLPLMALGIVIHLPMAFVFFGQLLMLAFEKSFFVGLAATAGSPLLLAAGLAKTSARVFVKAGRLLRIADWDCDPSMVITIPAWEGYPGRGECTAGMYWNAKRSIKNVLGEIKLQCLPDYNGAIVFE
jgi:hypothetical protein